MRDSRYVITEGLVGPTPPVPALRSQTAPPQLSVVDVNQQDKSRSRLSVQTDDAEKKPRRQGTLRRTMSLFKKDPKKRKSLPPLPSYTNSVTSDGSRTPNPHSSFYRNTFARTTSLISLAFGLTMTPTPPAKEPPPPVPPKDHRFYTRSDPPPLPSKSLIAYDLPMSATSSIGHFAPSSTGHGVVSNSGHEHDSPRERVPTVRDLAILPTQRIMRFVLLYRGQ